MATRRSRKSTPTVDLNHARRNDALVSRHGKVFTYMHPHPDDPNKHVIRDDDGNISHRNTAGFEHDSYRLPSMDHDIVKVIRMHRQDEDN